MRLNSFLIIILFLISKSFSNAQCLNVNFNIPNEVCLGENIIIQNSTATGLNYEWDFCGLDIVATPTITTKSTIADGNNTTGITVVTDGLKYYGFVVSRVNGRLYRLDFNDDLYRNPTLVNIGNNTTLSTGAEQIDIIQENGNWYGLIANLITSKVLLANFGNNLENVPIITEISVSVPIHEPRGIKVYKDGVNFIGLVGNTGNTLTRLNFGSSFNNIPIATNIIISGASGVYGISVIKECNNTYALISSYITQGIYRLNFGSSLLNSPTVTQLTLSTSITGRIVKIEAIEEGNKFYAVGVTLIGNVFRLEFGNSLSSNSPLVTNMGNFSVLNNFLGFSIMKYQSSYLGFVVDYASRIVRGLEFKAVCGANESYSSVFRPININYKAPGLYNITLKAKDINGNVASISKQINVKSSAATEINFTNTSCVTSPVSFSGTTSNSQDIKSWTWDFENGQSAMGKDVSIEYSEPGSYQVRLSVESIIGCKNTYEKEIKVYPQPVPNFTLPTGSICTNGEITLTNTTPGEYGDLITYEWDFGDGTTSTEKNPTHTYATGGTKTVTLKASIPGCEASKSYGINVLAGPEVNFTEANLCQGDETQFTDLSTGEGITKYSWDLGNGYTSTLQNPSVIYEAPGIYNVILTVENAAGCKNTFTKPVTIHALPQVSFINELACSGGPTQFYDRTVIPEANIDSWLWEIEGKTYDIKDPAHIFSAPGNYDVKLTVTSNFTCTASKTINISVLPGPTADFSFVEGCMGAATLFTDTSVDKDESGIIEWFWQISGQEFYTQNPEYVFESSGTYDVSLTITSGAFCQATVVKQVVINPLPVADFTHTPACAGDAITFTDNSSITGDDEIISRKWTFNGEASAEGPQSTFTFASAGSQQVILEITTKRGCIIPIQKTIEITPVPVVSFSVPSTLGAPPLTIHFNNTSAGDHTYTWYFGDAQQSTSTEVSPSFVYNELGEYQVSLVGVNSLGCSDTSRLTINLINPIVDLALEQISVVNNGSHRQIVLQISNKGSIPINDMDLILELGQEFSLKETFTGTINPEETINYLVAFELMEHSFTNLPFICVELQPKHPEYVEKNTVDNKICYDKTSDFKVYDLGPNPTSGELRVSYILPVKDKITFSIHNSMGSMVLQREVSDTRSGYNAFLFDLGHLNEGIYMFVTSYQGRKIVKKIVKE